jgi:hypothetical protein
VSPMRGLHQLHRGRVLVTAAVSTLATLLTAGYLAQMRSSSQRARPTLVTNWRAYTERGLLLADGDDAVAAAALPVVATPTILVNGWNVGSSIDEMLLRVASTLGDSARSRGVPARCRLC